MKKIILVVLALLLTISIVSSQPILKLETYDNNIDFYIMTVNGQELPQVELNEKYNWNIFEDMAKLNLPNGSHEIKVRVGNDTDESEDLLFYVSVEHLPTVITYKIIPDPENEDLIYQSKFSGSLKAEVYNDGVVIVYPPENDDSDDDGGGGGGGGGCFIISSSK
jgi:hypothetical protein